MLLILLIGRPLSGPDFNSPQRVFHTSLMNATVVKWMYGSLTD